MSALRREDAEEFTEALGQVLGGAVRLAEWAPDVGIPEALGLSAGEWAERRLTGAVRLSIPERRTVVAELTERGMSTREIGDALGVDHSTVANDRKAVENPTAEPKKQPPSAEVGEAPVESSTPEPEDDQAEHPLIEDTEVGQQADASVEVRRHRAMRDFMQAAEKTASLVPQIDHIIEGVLEVDAQRARDEAQRALDTWERVNGLLAGRSSIRRVK